ncbi:MAG: hypothetical protein ACRDRO_02150 [Pseudonocardiaceae bacterium]
MLDQRASALERVRFGLADLAHARGQVAVVEHRMRCVLDELGLTELVSSCPDPFYSAKTPRGRRP